MQAITRGWVVQVTPVHERSSPRASRFCFKFYTVTCGGGTAREQLGPACARPRGPSAASQAAEETRRWFRFHQLTSSASWAFGTGEGGRLAFLRGAGEWWHLQPASVHLEAATGRDKPEGL